MTDLKISKKTSYILLIIIILAGICRFSYGFFVQKESFHSDEVWSFGLANSYYEPYIQYTDNTSAFKNTDNWISGETFKEYLTVQEGERFSFGSVYYNLSCDIHPPLYFFLLHFLCSFFPNQYIFSIGFVINMIAYIFLALFMYKLLLLVTKSEVVSLIGVLFSTFSLGMLNMTMFVRMYLCVATLAIIYSYLSARFVCDETYRKKASSYILLGVTVLTGVLTDNFFLPYAFVTTLVICICLCTKKEIKPMIIYGLAALIGVVLSIIIFPKTFTSMLSFLGVSIGPEPAADTGAVVNSSYRYMPVFFQFKMTLMHIFKALFGHELITPYRTYARIYISCGLFIIVIIGVLLSFLFRKEPWFIKICSKAKTSIIHFGKTFNYVTLSLVLSSLMVCISAAYIADIYGLGATGDRYIFVCYPAVMITFVLAIWRILTLIFKRKDTIVAVSLVVILSICSVLSNMQTCTYLMKCPNTMRLEDISKDSNFIVIASSKWMLVQYAAKLYGCKEVFLTADYDFDKQIDNIKSHELSGDTYLLVDMTKMNVKSEADTKFQLAMGKAFPTYSSSKLTYTSQSDTQDTGYSLAHIIDTCRSFPFVDDIKYIGCDGLNFYKVNVYKVN